MKMAGILVLLLVSLLVSPSVVVLQAVIALIVPLGAAIIPVITGTRITVREAISDYGLGKGQFGLCFFLLFLLVFISILLTLLAFLSLVLVVLRIPLVFH